MTAAPSSPSTHGPNAVRSVYSSQSAILDAIEALHVRSGWDADITYGHGVFWRGRAQVPRLKLDIEPMLPDVVQGSSADLPLADASMGSVMFDPPFLTYVRAGRAHKGGAVQMTARFGGYWSYSDLQDHYVSTLRECARVLRKGGVLVVKCQDIIHNHRMHCTHAMVIEQAALAGFRLRDLFVLAAKHRMPSPQRGTQKHARIWHSYFLVFERVAR